mmetsp:Transcript_9775/g.22366  ORF Transcript_9775/g.22366 Transcript_9775/m.22366 type:complete len:241 (+) Transcript_9775:311-1033(+)
MVKCSSPRPATNSFPHSGLRPGPAPGPAEEGGAWPWAGGKSAAAGEGAAGAAGGPRARAETGPRSRRVVCSRQRGSGRYGPGARAAGLRLGGDDARLDLGSTEGKGCLGSSEEAARLFAGLGTGLLSAIAVAGAPPPSASAPSPRAKLILTGLDRGLTFSANTRGSVTHPKGAPFTAMTVSPRSRMPSSAGSVSFETTIVPISKTLRTLKPRDSLVNSCSYVSWPRFSSSPGSPSNSPLL